MSAHRVAALAAVFALAGTDAATAPAMDGGSPPAIPDEGADSIGLGNLGTTCTCPSSENSNGSGYGRGVGGLGPPTPMPADVWLDAVEARGGLDREIIRRLAQRHRAELLACYEPVVARRPTLGGKLTIRYTIGASGDVRTAAARPSALRHAGVAGCLVEAIRGWRFPQVSSGSATAVSQRFTLIPPYISGVTWMGHKRR
jgi:hypothetical protein